MTEESTVDVDETEAIHIVPLNDLREHTASSKCWCHPREDDEVADMFIHNAMDQRELYERGERKLS